VSYHDLHFRILFQIINSIRRKDVLIAIQNIIETSKFFFVTSTMIFTLELIILSALLTIIMNLYISYYFSKRYGKIVG